MLNSLMLNVVVCMRGSVGLMQMTLILQISIPW